MSTPLHYFRIFPTTETPYQYIWSSTVPTVSLSGGTIDTSKTTIINNTTVNTITNITDASSPYAALTTDEAIIGNTIAGSITVTLPDISTFKNISYFITNDGANNITITPFSGQTINILSTYILQPGHVVYLFPANADWTIYEEPITKTTYDTTTFRKYANDSGIEVPTATRKIIYVKKAGASANQFTSVKSALDSITDASATNLYTVHVSTGVYTEPEITVPSYVNLVGESILSVIIQPDTNNHHVINLTTNTEISFLTVSGAGTGFAGINNTNVGNFSQMHKISVQNCDICVLCNASTIDSQVYLEYVDFEGLFSYGIKIESQNNFEAFVSLENFFPFPLANASLIANIHATGSKYNIELFSGEIFGIGTEYGIFASGAGKLSTTGYIIGACLTGIYFDDGAQLFLTGININNCPKGILCGANGTNPNLISSGALFESCTRDVQINNLNCTGQINGIINYSKIHINSHTPIQINGTSGNVITVAKSGGYFASVSSAIAAITVTYNPIALTNSSTTATSSGLFSPIMTFYQIVGTGIPSNTTVTYVDDNTIQLSNAATQTTSTALTLLRSNSTTSFTIAVGPGIFAEPALSLPIFTTLKGSSAGASIITAASPSNAYVLHFTTSATIQELTFDGTAIKNISGRNTLFCDGCFTFSLIQNCVIANSNIGITVNGSVSNVAQFVGQNLYFVDCFKSIYLDATAATNGSNTISTTMGNILIGFKTIAPIVAITLVGPQGIMVFNNNQLFGTNMNDGSICLHVSDGANCLINSIFMNNWNYGIFNPETGTGCSIQMSNGFIEQCTRTIEINDSGTSGFFTGNTDFSKVFVNDSSQFFITNSQRNTLTVASKGANFTSINTALNSINPTLSISITNGSTTATSSTASFFKNLNNSLITAASGLQANTTVTYVDDSTITLSLAATATQTMDAKFFVSSATNQFIISVGPGTYTESQISIDKFISLIGSGKNITILTSATTTQPFILLDDNATVSNLAVSGINGTGGIGIQINTDATECNISNCSIISCETGIKCSNPSQIQEVSIDNSNISGSCTTGIFAQSNAGNSLVVNCTDIDYEIDQANITCVYANGSNLNIKIHDSIFNGSGLSYTGVVLDDGVFCSISTSTFNQATTAIHDTNVGAAKHIEINTCVFNNSTTYDINSEHPSSTGTLIVSVNPSKIAIASSLISANYLDNSGTADISIAGKLNLGNNQANLTNVSDLIFDVPIMGLVDGGMITLASGLQINISSGFGYCASGTIPNHIVKRQSWASVTNFSLAASSTLYVYITFAGSLTTSTSKPDTINNIIMGRVRTSATTIEFIDNSPIKSFHSGNNHENFDRDVFGAIFVAGSIVIVNASLQAAVSSGKYYLGGDLFGPSGSTAPTTFSAYFHSSGSFTFTSGQTVIDNTQYDNVTNLTALTTSYYTKHTLYLVGDGVNERYMLVYGQNQYQLLSDAELGALPIPPPYFNEGVVIIASIIVQEGTTFSEAISQRPLPTFSAASINTTLFHGNLLGLLDDDHPQYLLVDGTRAMAGDLNMGTNNITSVGTINAVTVEAHESRHLPNGVDPLTTASPVTIIGSTTLNSIGTANSLARSDHVHAVSLSSFEINQLGATVPLSVSKGGTGANTLTAGNFLTGNGTNQVVTTKVVPTGTVVGTTDIQTLTNKTIIDSSNIISGFLKGGNITVVDIINGNDGTASINGLPFQTITAALAVAPAGTTIWLYPGTYNENSLVMPANICLRGINAQSCIISSTVTISTTLITVNTNCRIEDISLNLTGNTNAAITLQCVVLSGTSAATSKIRTTNINVSSTSNNNATLYGIRSNGTGIPSSATFITVRATTVNVSATSATSGNAYGLYVDSASGINMSETNFGSTGGAGITSYAVVTNNASASVKLRSGTITGSTGDYLVSAGSIDFSGVQLSTSSTIFSRDSNQLILKRAGFSTIINAQATTDRIVTLPNATDTLVGKDTTDTLTNKNMSNTTTLFVDPTTASKAIKFDTSTATASSTLTLAGIQTTNRTISFFDATDTIIGRNTTDTLTNKTITNPTISSINNGGTLTLPTGPDTLVARTSTDTMTNKTLTAPVIATIVNTGTLTLPTSTDTLVGRNTTDTLTNKSLVNQTTSFADSTTASKAIKFDTSGASASSTLTLAGVQTATRTLNFPDATDTIVARNTTDTLTNKNMSNSTVLFVDPTTASKAIQFDTSGATASSKLTLAAIQPINQTLTFPTKIGTLAAENNNAIRVEKGGSDTTGARNGFPFLTITAALAVAQSGDVVVVSPGTYTETITIPSGVHVRGASFNNTILSKVATVATDLVTMGTSSRLENMSLSLTSSTVAATPLRGIVFPTTTTAASKIRGILLTVDNSGLLTTDTTNVYGIHSNGTGTPSESTTNIRSTTVIVNSVGLGAKRGILVDTTANNLHTRDTTIYCNSSGGAGSYIGYETNIASAVCTLKASSCAGASADISQTAGTLLLVATDLGTSTTGTAGSANGKGFGMRLAPPSMIWAQSGNVATGFCYPGPNASTANEIFIVISYPIIVNGMTIRYRTGTTTTDTVTLRKNGVDTALAISVTAATSGSNLTTSVSYNSGDTMSMKYTRGNAGATDAMILLYTY